MPLRIEDYALIGDCETAALVGRDGSIDWLCFPRFDSDACFAALLGEPGHGHWTLAPAGDVTRVSRRYRGDTLILETDLETDEGAVRLIEEHAGDDLFRLRQQIFIVEQECIFPDIDGLDPLCQHVLGLLDGRVVIDSFTDQRRFSPDMEEALRKVRVEPVEAEPDILEAIRQREALDQGSDEGEDAEELGRYLHDHVLSRLLRERKSLGRGGKAKAAAETIDDALAEGVIALHHKQRAAEDGAVLGDEGEEDAQRVVEGRDVAVERHLEDLHHPRRRARPEPRFDLHR